MSPAVQAALIGAATSTIITPFVQLIIDAIKRRRDRKERVAPILEHIRFLHGQLLQLPINPSITGVTERILAIEQFYDPLFNDPQNHFIKTFFLDRARYLDGRHKHTRPWMEIEYPQEQLIFGNAVERLTALLNGNKIPEFFDPSK